MKRHGHLRERLCSFESLLCAAEQARRGKRFRPGVAAFHYHLETALCRILRELESGSWRPGAYRTFVIHHPKRRVISAAPYADRVVHHALVNVLEPIVERTFIADSFACRRGKGTHAAVHRCQQFARRFPYVFKADIRKFFPSVDHSIAKRLVTRKIKDRRVLDLLSLIIDSSNAQEPAIDWYLGDDLFSPLERPHGIPIGNQTSQFLASVYLDPLDHFVKETLRARGYVRYVDDFLVFGADKRELARVRGAITDFLLGLRLRIHPRKNTILRVADGIRFVGYRVFPTHVLLPKENVRRFRRRARRMQADYARGAIDAGEIQASQMSWLGHARQADTHRLQEAVLATLSFQRAAVGPPGAARRLV